MTTTDLALPPTSGTVSLIQQTALELTAAHQIASAICSTSFVPQHFRGKPDECAVAILYGATIGFDPVTAVQQIFVIGGKPALYARAMVAIVLSQGHEIWTEEEGPGRVVVAGRRKGSDKVQRVEWTTALAQQAGYTSNAKYRTDPRSMLYARASGDVARRIAPDALMGMAYNVEELELGEVTATPVPSERSGVSRLRAAVPASVPDQGGTEPASVPPARAIEAAPADDVHDAEVDEPPTEAMTTAQNRKIHALFRDLGITDENHQRAGMSKALGREVPSRKDLTKTEAAFIIEALEARAAQQSAPADAASAGQPAFDADADHAWLAGQDGAA